MQKMQNCVNADCYTNTSIMFAEAFTGGFHRWIISTDQAAVLHLSLASWLSVSYEYQLQSF